MAEFQQGRLISSKIVDSGPSPAVEERTRVVHVPDVTEVIRKVPKKEYVTVEKVVPRYEHEYREHIVEVPQIQTIHKEVEVPQYKEVITHVPKHEVIEIPVEVIRYVPKIETKIVEQEVEVPGKVIEVPKVHIVEKTVIVPRYIDTEVPTVVSQKVQPVVVESQTKKQQVNLKEYVPYLVPVPVYVPKPVDRELVPGKRVEEHRAVDVPPSQFNALVSQMNPNLSDTDIDGLYVKQVGGAIPMLQGMGSHVVPPVKNDWQATHHEGVLRVSQVPGQAYVMPAASTPTVGTFMRETAEFGNPSGERREH